MTHAELGGSISAFANLWYYFYLLSLAGNESLIGFKSKNTPESGAAKISTEKGRVSFKYYAQVNTANPPAEQPDKSTYSALNKEYSNSKSIDLNILSPLIYIN